MPEAQRPWSELPTLSLWGENGLLGKPQGARDSSSWWRGPRPPPQATEAVPSKASQLPPCLATLHCLNNFLEDLVLDAEWKDRLDLN